MGGLTLTLTLTLTLALTLALTLSLTLTLTLTNMQKLGASLHAGDTGEIVGR